LKGLLTSLLLASFILTEIVTGTGQVLADDYVDRVRKPIRQSITIRQKTQKNRESWQGERAELTARLQELQGNNRQLLAEQKILPAQIAATRQKAERFQQQIENSAHLAREIRPYLELVYQKLVDLVAADRPFLRHERQNRLDKLRLLLDDPDLTISEKYRRTMETLFIEAEYGSSVEIVRESIKIADRELTVNIFRLGRISIFFQSPDKNRTGYFDAGDQTWKEFPASYNREINTAYEIAAKRRPIKMVNLPLGRLVIP